MTVLLQQIWYQNSQCLWK